MITTRTLFAIPFALCLAGCGKEAARVPFSAEGEQTATATLAAGDVSFWTDIDIEYKGNAALSYDIELSQDGAAVATASCNPLGSMSIKVAWVETNLGDSHTREGSGKMGCSAKLPKPGPTTVKAKLAFAQKPASLTLRKADLVLKQ